MTSSKLLLLQLWVLGKKLTHYFSLSFYLIGLKFNLNNILGKLARIKNRNIPKIMRLKLKRSEIGMGPLGIKHIYKDTPWGGPIMVQYKPLLSPACWDLGGNSFERDCIIKFASELSRMNYQNELFSEAEKEWNLDPEFKKADKIQNGRHDSKWPTRN